MTKKIIKFAAISVAVILGLVVAAFFSAYLWLSHSERNANYMKPYVESVLTKKLGGTPVAITDIILGVNKENRAIAIRGEEIGIGVTGEKSLIMLPKISLEVGLADLFMGRVGLGDIALENLIITFTRSKEGKFYIMIGRKAGPEDPGIALQNLGFGGGYSSSSDYYIKSMQVVGGAVYYYDLENSLSAKAEGLHFQVGQGVKNTFQVSLDAEVQTGQNTGKINLVATVKKRNLKYESTITLENFRGDFLKGLPAPVNMAGGLELPLSGSVFIEGNAARHTLNELRFDADLGEGILNMPTMFEGKPTIQSAKISGYAKDNFSQLELNSFEVQLAKGILKGNFALSKKQSGHLVELKAELKDMPGDYMKVYWPLPLYPNIRNWVTGNIRGGFVPKAYVNLHLDPDDIKPGKNWPKPDDVDSEVVFEGSELEYLKGFPKVTNVSGKAIFTGEKMDIPITAGKSLGSTNVTSARVEIRNFHDKHTRMYVSADATGPLSDAFAFLKNPVFGNVNEEFGFNPEKAAGDVKAKVALDFYLSPVGPKHNPYDLKYNISGTSENASASGILEGFDVTSGKLDTKIDNQEITIAGTAAVNGVPLKLNIEKPIEANAAHTFKLHAKTLESGTAITDLGIPALNFIKGKLDFNLDYTGFAGSNNIKLTADLKGTELDHKNYGRIKPAGEPASLSLSGLYKEKEKQLEFSSLNLEGGKVAISGAVTIDTAKGELQAAQLKSVRFGSNDFSMDMGKDKDGVESMNISGRSIDISPFVKNEKPSPERSRIAINVERAYSVNETSANSFQLRSDCEGNVCYFMDMKGYTINGDAPFHVSINPGQNGKTLEASAENAGDFLRFIDSYSTMKDGKLTAQGTYKNFGKVEQLEGKAVINDFRITHTPVLAKLLSIASLTGILDGLNSTGISFSKLEIPFTRSGSTITIKDAKCSGASLGLTGEGNLDEESRQMNLKGTVVPAYVLNSLISNVPLIGQVLTGGKGKGVFAFNFTASGPFDNPDINVNPLSVITPGFLRDLFSADIPEGTPPAPTPAPIEKNPPAETPNNLPQ